MRYLTICLLLICALPGHASRCIGAKDCHACRNCNYCKWCNSGGTCGVKARRLGAVDEIKTVRRSFPFPDPPESTLSKKNTIAKMRDKWSIKVWWRKEMYDFTSVNSGFEVLLATPEVISAFAKEQAKEQLMNDAEAQKLYEEKLKQYWGDDLAAPVGSKISFLGNLQLNSKTYHVEDMDADWQFYLFTEDGKRYKASAFTLGDVKAEKMTNALSATPKSWLRTITVTFDNIDPETHQPIFTKETHLLALGIGSRPGQGKAEFVFTPRKSR